MIWDWKKLLDSEEPTLEEPSPEEAPVAVGDSPGQATKESSGTAFQGASGDAPAPTERAAGLVWQTTGPTGKTGRATRCGRLPQLLYGRENDCAFCKGTGMMKGDNLCPVCHGAGKVSLTPPVVQCPFCHGKGKKTLNSTVTCLVCKGKGVVTVTPPIEVCPNCNGRGRQRGHSLYCGLCRGTGVITARAREQGQRRSNVA